MNKIEKGDLVKKIFDLQEIPDMYYVENIIDLKFMVIDGCEIHKAYFELVTSIFREEDNE